MKITFVTSNEHKVREAKDILSGIAQVEHIEYECKEIRAESVEEVVREKALDAFSVLHRPLIVDDTGFFIKSLKGFPGTCAAYVHKTIGNEGILKLMSGNIERSAWFETAIGYTDGSITEIFTGRVDGHIVGPRGSGGFGYDPIFQVYSKTLAQMSMQEKNRISHRSIALHSFKSWLSMEDENPDNGTVEDIR